MYYQLLTQLMIWVLLVLLICHTYDEHYTHIIRLANSMCAVILHNFASRNASFFRIVVAYMRPLLEYASQLWSPSTVNIINRIERV